MVIKEIQAAENWLRMATRRSGPSATHGYEITEVPLKNLDGSISKLRVLYDITERKDAETMKDEFIGLVSHELRTPLTVILGSLKTAMSVGVSPDEKNALIANATQGADALNAILENMLELSRCQNNRLLLRRQQVRISNLAQSVIRKLEDQGATQRFIVEFRKDLPAIEADSLRL